MRSPENLQSDSFFTDEMLEQIAEDNRKAQEAERLRPKLKSEKIYHKEIEDLIEPMTELLIQLRYNLESGKYNLIIGEDASGRIPALIVKQVADHIYAKHDYPKPQLKFIAGFQIDVSRGLDSADIDYLNEYEQRDLAAKIDRLKNDFSQYKGGKALLVTDYIYIGKSTKSIKSILNEVGVDVDIATVKSSLPVTGVDEYDTFSGSTNQTGHREPSIIYRYNLGGVSKDANHPYANKYRTENNLTEPRSDVENVAKKIIENLEK